MNKKVDGYKFWKNVDIAKESRTILDIANESKLNYKTIKTQRSNNTLPNGEDIYSIAQAIGVSMEFLLTGINPKNQYSTRIKAIIDKCIAASENDLILVERILRIEEKNTILKEKKSI